MRRIMGFLKGPKDREAITAKPLKLQRLLWASAVFILLSFSNKKQEKKKNKKKTPLGAAATVRVCVCANVCSDTKSFGLIKTCWIFSITRSWIIVSLTKTNELLIPARRSLNKDLRWHQMWDVSTAFVIAVMKQRAWNKVRPNYLISPLKTNQLNQASSVIIHPQ